MTQRLFKVPDTADKVGVNPETGLPTNAQAALEAVQETAQEANAAAAAAQAAIESLPSDAQPALKVAANLSDLSDVTVARTNLGLGSCAILNAGLGANQVLQLDVNGLVPVSAIPVVPATGVSETNYGDVQTAVSTLKTGVTTNATAIGTAQSTANAAGALATAASAAASTAQAGADASLKIANNLSDGNAAIMRTNLGLGGAAVLNIGTTAGTICAGDDSRLSNARTPTSHALTHASAGTDPITIAQSQVTNLVTDLAAKGTGSVQSINIIAPSWLTPSGGPVTGIGTLTLTATTLQAIDAQKILATQPSGTGTLQLRAVDTSYISNLDASTVIAAKNGFNKVIYIGEVGGAAYVFPIAVADMANESAINNTFNGLYFDLSGLVFKVNGDIQATGMFVGSGAGITSHTIPNSALPTTISLTGKVTASNLTYTKTLIFSVSGGAVTTVQGDPTICDADGSIVQWDIFSYDSTNLPVNSTVTFDIKRASYGNWKISTLTTMTTGALVKPNISADKSNQGTSFTSWNSVTVSAGDRILAMVDASQTNSSSASVVKLVITIRRT